MFFCGGGVTYKKDLSIKTDGLPMLIKAIDEFMDNKQKRNIQKELFDKYKDSLQLKDNEELFKLLN